MVCHCFQVTRDTIREAIMLNRLETIEDITNFTKAGGGCGDCHPELTELLKESWEKLRLQEAGQNLPQGAEEFPVRAEDEKQRELLSRIQDVLDNDIARALRTDGGDIELVRFNDNRVYVRLTGSCASCLASDATIKGWVENQLQEQVSKDLEVIEVKT
jgi:NifU-like protein